MHILLSKTPSQVSTLNSRVDILEEGFSGGLQDNSIVIRSCGDSGNNGNVLYGSAVSSNCFVFGRLTYSGTTYIFEGYVYSSWSTGTKNWIISIHNVSGGHYFSGSAYSNSTTLTLRKSSGNEGWDWADMSDVLIISIGTTRQDGGNPS